MRRGLVCLLLAFLPSVSFAAEPLTMLLLGILRHQVATAVQDAIERAQREKERPAVVVPRSPYDLGDHELRMLIDEGFVHLSRGQRDEVFAGVKRILADPANAAARPLIIQELAIKASAVRQAHEELASLSTAEKRAIVAQIRDEYEKLSREERVLMLEVLQSGVAPLPRDLNEMILAEFRRVPAAGGPSSPEQPKD
jgi:hypothetical protein